MNHVSSSTLFFFVRYVHIHVPFIMYCSRFFVDVLSRNLTLFVGSQNFVPLQSIMFVNAVVSDVRDLNRNKKSNYL